RRRRAAAMERRAVLQRLLREARPYYARLALAMLLGVLAGALPMVLLKVPELLTKRVLIVDSAVGAPLHRHIDWPELWLVVAIILGSQIVGSFAGYGQSYLTAYSGQRMIATFRSRLFDRVNRLSLLDFDRWRPGEFLARFSSDLALMTDAVSISF